jgi:nucleotide-binding universal stress UspA family protein
LDKRKSKGISSASVSAGVLDRTIEAIQTWPSSGLRREVGRGNLAVEQVDDAPIGRAKMAYKDILVFLDPTAEAVERARFAASLAKSHGARLIAVDIGKLANAEGIDPGSATRRMFADATKDAGVSVLFVPAEEPEEGEALSHCVDLMIAPAPDSPARNVIRHGALDRALVDCGAPMLILPPDWKPGPIGDKIVIAWNGGREALRAVHDAMPLLKRAQKVTLFAFSSRPSALRKSAEKLADHLAAHSVKAEHISDWTNTGDLSAVEALFASLDTQDADLIVAGAFGHSRLYEGLFGGVTVDLIHQQSLPVLMSH